MKKFNVELLIVFLIINTIIFSIGVTLGVLVHPVIAYFYFLIVLITYLAFIIHSGDINV